MKKSALLSLCQDHKAQIGCELKPAEGELIIKNLITDCILQSPDIIKANWGDMALCDTCLCDQVDRAFRDLKPSTVEVLVFFLILRVKGSVIENIEG